MTRSPRKAPDLEDVAGFVVLIINPDGHPAGWLTCSDVMTLERAEHEAKTWRHHSAGTGKRYLVCPVLKGLGALVSVSEEDGNAQD